VRYSRTSEINNKGALSSTDQRHHNEKLQISLRTLSSTTRSITTPRHNRRSVDHLTHWKRKQQNLSTLQNSLRDGASKPDGSHIESAIAKLRSPKSPRSPIQPKEEFGAAGNRFAFSTGGRHENPANFSVSSPQFQRARRMYITTARMKDSF
jgi:hypothetical protein